MTAEKMWVDCEFKKLCESIAFNLNEAGTAQARRKKPRYKPIDVTRFMCQLGFMIQNDGNKRFKKRLV